jgi:DNA polymerase elongation subunit (family B)
MKEIKKRIVLMRRKLAFKVFANSVYGSYVMHNSESVFKTLLIITKKRYIGKFAVDKMIHKGIVVLRGDTCAFLKIFTLW